MLVKPIYKCLLCGQLLTTGKPQDVPREALPGLLGKVVQNQIFAGNPYLYQAPMHIPCKCKDGNAGMAYFAGFMQAEAQGQRGRLQP
ncbi:MAG: hypothetical protein K2O18_16425 [Oscillospiraceae bacterium]|nr:hypothetical protein [Oscillospiraceae bacterium]